MDREIRKHFREQIRREEKLENIAKNRVKVQIN